MSLCGHTSISALFRFQVLNYFSIPVELRITYLLAIGRVCTQIAHRQNTDTPNIVIDSCRATRVVVSRGSSRHLSARSGSVVSYLQTTYTDVRRHWHAVSARTPCNIHIVYSKLIPKSKILNSIKMAIFSCRLAPRLAR